MADCFECGSYLTPEDLIKKAIKCSGSKSALVLSGATLNYNPSADEDLSVYYKTRSGLTLVDEVSANNATTQLPYLRTVVGGNPFGIKTGVIPDANTIMILRCSVDDFNFSVGLAANFRFTTGDSAGQRWGMFWGDLSGYTRTTKYGSSDILFDTGWHTHIIYNKRYWLLDGNISLTDANILNIINTVTPNINIIPAVWVTATTDIRLLTSSYNITGYMKGNHALNYIGNISGGVLTWQKKYVFTNRYSPYDVFNGVKGQFVNSADEEVLNTTTYQQVKYGENGYDLLTNGHSTCYLEGTGFVSVPLSEAGTPITGNPVNFVRLHDIAGNITKHNLADSIIRFPLGSIWDRSSTTVYEDAARAATTFYYVANPTDWHITELNRLLLQEWLKTDYLGIWFPHETPNSVDIEAKILLDEILAYSANKTGSDFDKVLIYTGDYNLVVI